jgi:hypothetical protein
MTSQSDTQVSTWTIPGYGPFLWPPSTRDVCDAMEARQRDERQRRQANALAAVQRRRTPDANEPVDG